MTGYLYRGSPRLELLNEQIMAARTASSREPRARRAGCGTEAGWKRHMRAGEPACPECRAAASKARADRK